MRFWDSSAITPLLVDEADSQRREQQLGEDGVMVVWYATAVEIESALNRRIRDGSLSGENIHFARQRLQQLTDAWVEVEPSNKVRDRALRLLRVHPLRAADTLQLAAALVVCDERTHGFFFLTGDQRLHEAATAEGFSF